MAEWRPVRELETHERRDAPRRRLLYATSVRLNDGSVCPVLVRDISARGLLLERESSDWTNQAATITLPEVGDVEMRVVWSDHGLIGCRLKIQLSETTIHAIRTLGQGSHGTRGLGIAPPSRRFVSKLGERIKQLRMRKGLTRATLAERSGISMPSIWAWETDRTVPRLGSLENLAKGLGVSVRELTADTDPVDHKMLVGAGGAAMALGEHLSGQLDQAVAASKEQIAALLGVTANQVSITVDL